MKLKYNDIDYIWFRNESLCLSRFVNAWNGVTLSRYLLVKPGRFFAFTDEEESFHSSQEEAENWCINKAIK